MNSERSILVADDDDIFSDMLVDSLLLRGFDSAHVATGKDVISSLQKKHYDVLLCDINMPGNENLVLIDELKRVFPQLPIILMTGKPTIENAVGSIKRTVQDFLIKPFPLNDLFCAIEKSLNRDGLQNMLATAKENIDTWGHELDCMYEETIFEDVDKKLLVDRFISLSLKNMISCINDLHAAVGQNTDEPTHAYPCRHFNCTRFSEMVEIITESIAVIERTRKSFKSKELQKLREYLQAKLEKLLIEQRTN